MKRKDKSSGKKKRNQFSATQGPLCPSSSFIVLEPTYLSHGQETSTDVRWGDFGNVHGASS